MRSLLFRLTAVVAVTACLPVPCVAAPCLLAQGPAGDESAPIGLKIIIVDVGQGSGCIIQAPDGGLHVFDAGNNGDGTNRMVPLLRSLGTSYRYTFLSHYHADHGGGIDEVLGALAFQFAYDRGDANASGSTYTGHIAAAGARRRTVTPGQVIALGGGATARVLAVNGSVVGGTNVPVSGTSQEENSRSIALRIEYGRFSMWLGGDLTGGANGTADVESPAAQQCGDVDVYIADHHGSVTSTNATLWALLEPELAMVSCGTDNSYGHPHNETINLVNRSTRVVPLLSTTVGARKIGYGVANGHMTLVTDGERYRLTAPTGQFLDFLVDEVSRVPAAGDVVISEFHRDPAAVADAAGEYFELTNVSGAPVALRGLRLVTSNGLLTFGTNMALYPGRPVLLPADGDGSRNGGLPLGVTWPYNSIALGNSSGSIALQSAGGATLDSLSYTSSFPGGTGVASERKDLLAPASTANFVPAPFTYGLGDRGSPGRRNGGDTTRAAGKMVVEASASSVTLRATAISHGGYVSVLGLSFGNTGFPFLDGLIPIDPDPLFMLSTNLPGCVALLPAEGYRSLTLDLPAPNPLVGVAAYAAHIVLDLGTPSVGTVSSATRFVFQ